MKRHLMAWLLVVCILLTMTACSSKTTGKVRSDGIVQVVLDEDTTYYADIEIKNYGTITVQLDQSAAPVTVENFVSLAKSGYYEGLTFHRIIAGFMMQGGAPTSIETMTNSIVGEFSENGYENPILHKRGVISMARSQDYNSANSQFFIMHMDYPSLDGKYAAFGQVIEGMEVVDAICFSARPINYNGGIAPEAQPVIKKITIREE